MAQAGGWVQVGRVLKQKYARNTGANMSPRMYGLEKRMIIEIEASELEASFMHYLELANAGEALAITKDGSAIARLSPIQSHDVAQLISTSCLTILPWSPTRAQSFHDINAQWIEAMFVLEDTDRAVLENPQELIIDKGGDILFVAVEGLGIVGACALMPAKLAGAFELTKMGVLDSARGIKAGEFLLAAVLDRAREMKIATLFLLTNKKCEAAIHLYQKLGFVHDAGIMATYGALYERCNVAMLFAG
jgi:N-acetylglutamate synthase-like GNAT family acetyltransferase/antitoxin (DNA-binding transcriptional repressor) of toxin-antitoxin stability system